MNTIGAMPIVVQAAIPQAAPAVPAATAAPIGGSRAAAQVPQPVPVEVPAVEVSARSIEQQRYAAVNQAAQRYANINVLGTTTFTIFKDAAGTLVTRFFDRTSGDVKYVPEPELRRDPLVNIDA